MRQAKTRDVPKENEISVSSALCAGRLGRRRAGDGLAEDRGEMTIHWMLQSLFGKVLPSRNSARATIADDLLREVQVCA